MKSQLAALNDQFHRHVDLESAPPDILDHNANNCRKTRNRHALNTALETCGSSQRTDQLSSTGTSLISVTTLPLPRSSRRVDTVQVRPSCGDHTTSRTSHLTLLETQLHAASRCRCCQSSARHFPTHSVDLKAAKTGVQVANSRFARLLAKPAFDSLRTFLNSTLAELKASGVQPPTQPSLWCIHHAHVNI